MQLTGTDIVNLLQTNDRAVMRALIVLFNRQTADEQRVETTCVHNNRGFRSCDAKIGTSMAKFALRTGYLTPKQLAYWRKPTKRGGPRIGVYWRQLLDEARAKAASAA